MKRFLFSIIFFLASHIFPGFAAGTLVKVCHGYKSIEEIQVGDLVYSATTSGRHDLCKVSAVTSYWMPQAVLALVEDDAVIASPMQKFFDPRTKTWCKAQSLYLMDYFITSGGHFVCLDAVYDIEYPCQFFDIRLESEHAFFVTKKNIIAHNFPLVFIGMSWAFGGGITFQGLHVGICILGLWLGTKLFKKGGDLICKPLVIGKTLDGIANDDWYEVFASNDDQNVNIGNYELYAECLAFGQAYNALNYKDKKPTKPTMKDIKKELEDKKKNSGGGPEKGPSEKLKLLFWYDLLKNYLKKAWHYKFGNFYKDAKTGLWWSKAQGGQLAHSGPHYKVFTEGTKGLDWIYDADLLGNIIPKHKGPIGLHIPYKELRFLP